MISPPPPHPTNTSTPSAWMMALRSRSCSQFRSRRGSLHPSPAGSLLHSAEAAHKTKKVSEFLEQHPNVKLHFTPTYSSWLNQVEIWFGRIEREVIARGIFTSVKDLARKLMHYI